MLTRLTHAAIAFAITVVVYQAYVLIAAPWIAPLSDKSALQRVSDQSPHLRLEPAGKYRELLAAYFPPHHWTLTQPPITAENGQAMVLIDEFNPRDDGQVRVKKCAMLFFPSGRVPGEPPPRDAIVLEAPHGAVLQMDKSLRRPMGSLGRLQYGTLTGRITVRSDMRDPGPEDDLLLTTHDVYMNEDLIHTDNFVEMQLGPHRGRGRELEIRLVDIERGRSDNDGPNLGSIDSLEIAKDVKAIISPGHVQLTTPAPIAGTGPESPPVHISSRGKFRFDFSSQLASFSDDVRLTQVYPEGPADELLCSNFLVYFTNPAGDSLVDQWSPGMIEALGDSKSPVTLNARSQQATARCERMRIELGPRRVTFDRGSKVTLTYQGNEIEAQQVQYTAPPEDSEQRVGDFQAFGRGWLRALPSDKPGTEPLEVRWIENMRLRRINGRPVLSLNGRPLLGMVGFGQLWADHLDLYLRESPVDGSEAALLPADIVPERLVAGGNIDIDSAQLRGDVKQLDVRFEYAPDTIRTTPNENSPRTDGDRLHSSRLGQHRRGNAASYDIRGETLQMLVTIHQKLSEVTSIDIGGQVVFSESAVEQRSTPTSGQQPLVVKADRLKIKNADSPAAEIALVGTPATIAADGMLIRTENLQIERGRSRAWVNAPGEIEVSMDRDLQGKRLASPRPMTIRWQRGMELEQDQIVFSGGVQVLTGDGTLDTNQLVVQLSAPVRFDGTANQRKIAITQLECTGGAKAIFSQRDALGLASLNTMQLEESFTVNLKTGELRGTGPGWLESVHLGGGDNPLGELASGSRRGQLASTQPAWQSQQSGPSRQAQRLRFLGVQFFRGLAGNLDSQRGRKVEVYGNVEAVYGPVDAWEQRLALTKRGLPGPDTIWISCQRLGVAESPLARLNRSQESGLGPIELRGQGNVTIEGPAGVRGNFTTHSREAKFDQLKKTFILEGDDRLPATLTYHQFQGSPPQTTKARKITYFQTTGKLRVDGLMSGQLRQLAPGGR